MASAWTDDPEEHRMIFLGQCACGDNWTDKQAEARSTRLEKYFDFNHAEAPVLFVARCLRDGRGRWARARSVEKGNLLLAKVVSRRRKHSDRAGRAWRVRDECPATSCRQPILTRRSSASKYWHGPARQLG